MKNINKDNIKIYNEKKYIMKVISDSNTIREVENIKRIQGNTTSYVSEMVNLSKTKKGGWELVRNLIQMFFLSLSHPDYHQS